MSEVIVADAGPLIGLARAGLISLLTHLYERVLVPTAVLEELQLDGARPGSAALAGGIEAGWLACEPLAETEDLASLLLVLDRGEAEAVLLAASRPAHLLLIAERRGRAVARSRGLRVVGTGGILLNARRAGLLAESLESALERLAAAGYRLSPALRAEILRLA